MRVACFVVIYGLRWNDSSVGRDERGRRLSPRVLRSLRDKRPRGCGYQSASVKAVPRCRIRTSNLLTTEYTSFHI